MAKLSFTGNLGANPVAKTTKTGKEYVILSVAEQISNYDKKSNEWIATETQWHSVFIFSPTVQAHALKLQKGEHIEVKGTLSYYADENAEGTQDDNISIIAHHVKSSPLTKTS